MLGFHFRVAEYYQVVGVSHHLVSRFIESHIYRVQVDIDRHWTDDGALRCPC